MPPWPITKVKFQGRYQGFQTDDIIVFCESSRGEKAKLLCQCKLDLKFTPSSTMLTKTLKNAWDDYHNTAAFSPNDLIAIVTGPLSGTDTNGVRKLLRQAENSEDEADFINRIQLGKFTSQTQRTKLEVFKGHLKTINGGADLADRELWLFLKRLRLFIYDLDILGVVNSLLRTICGVYEDDANGLLAKIEQEVTYKSCLLYTSPSPRD